MTLILCAIALSQAKPTAYTVVDVRTNSAFAGRRGQAISQVITVESPKGRVEVVLERRHSKISRSAVIRVGDRIAFSGGGLPRRTTASAIKIAGR